MYSAYCLLPIACSCGDHRSSLLLGPQLALCELVGETLVCSLERLRLGSRAHHLARAEDERGGLRGTNTHDRRCETLRGENGGGPRQYQATKWNTEKVCTPASPQEVRVSSHLRVVLHITGVERDGL